MSDQPVSPYSDGIRDDYRMRALVGWTHATLPHGIDLRVQCAVSSAALENQEIEVQHLLMTRNQALLLAKYLLDITGQTLPSKQRPSLLGRFWGGGNR
ncbi:hypothetical protein BH10PSE12_BH10PSE12_05230 [soil metagenome]